MLRLILVLSLFPSFRRRGSTRLSPSVASNPARGEVLFLERREGESAVLPCEVEPSTQPPYGVYLKRSWRSPAEVLFMHSGSDFTVAKDEDKARIAVSGDPASLALNVSLSQLRAADTDRYSCEFMVEKPSTEDLRLPGKTEFFLLVVGGTGGGGGSAGEPLSFPHKRVSNFPFRFPQTRWSASTRAATTTQVKSFVPVQM